MDFTVCYSATVLKKKQQKILTFFKMGNSHLPGIYRYIVKYGLLFTHQENTAHICIPFPTKEDILKPVPKLLSTSLFSLPENRVFNIDHKSFWTLTLTLTTPTTLQTFLKSLKPAIDLGPTDSKPTCQLHLSEQSPTCQPPAYVYKPQRISRFLLFDAVIEIKILNHWL